MNKNRRSILWGCCLCLATVLPGQSDATVKLGQSCALTGPASFLGQQVHKGAMSYLNAHAGDEMELLVKDDGYEPIRSLENTETFLKEGVDALFGYVGTPTSKDALPLAMENEVLFFAPFTGASFLSDAQENPYSFAVRASYDAEIENMIRHLKENLKITRIGLFVQRDSFGMAGVRAVVQAQEKIGGVNIVPPIPKVPSAESSMDEWNEFWKSVPNYRRNTVSVGGAVRQVRGHAVDAVILVGSSRPCALAINQWHEIGFNVPMLNISFVGSTALTRRLKDTDNVYISQVVPDPWDNSLPLVKQYQQDMGSDEYGFASLEGYLSAKIFHQALAGVKGEVTTAALKDAIEAMSKYDAGGVDVSFGKDDHRGMDSVYLTKVDKSGDTFKFTYVDTLSPVSPGK
ncbi:MAG: ABC transporter substrate-binding protein [Candidatus Electrothrix sp. Rat3]|nr:ABC transporter substrate-binding protein [Candidatus Electrothrix rattekaaiensis]